MGSEIRRMFLGKVFWMGLAVAMAGIVFGAAYPKIEGLLDTGKFVNMEAEALKSQAMIFLLPLAAVLPWSDSFLLERQGGFLKSALPRTGRRVYVESKVFTVALGGFLAVFLAGMSMFFIYILFFVFGGTGKVSLEFCVGAYRDSFTLRDAGRHHQYFRGNLRSPDRLRVSGFWPAFCVLLFLCDIKGQIL